MPLTLFRHRPGGKGPWVPIEGIAVCVECGGNGRNVATAEEQDWIDNPETAPETLWGFGPGPDTNPDQPAAQEPIPGRMQDLLGGLPVRPYPEPDSNTPTSGWSGSETSHDRAVTEDASGVTTRRQAQALHLLDQAGRRGLTWQELARHANLHHGQASGVLSVLHKDERIARLAGVRRDRCAIYVALDHVAGRETIRQGRGRSAEDPCPYPARHCTRIATEYQRLVTMRLNALRLLDAVDENDAPLAVALAASLRATLSLDQPPVAPQEP